MRAVLQFKSDSNLASYRKHSHNVALMIIALLEVSANKLNSTIKKSSIFLAVCLLLMSSSTVLAQKTGHALSFEEGQSLSDALIMSDLDSDAQAEKSNSKKLFLPGMQWIVPEEEEEQKKQKQALIDSLRNSKESWVPGWSKLWGTSAGGTPSSRMQLENRLKSIPSTGRVLLPSQDPYVLEAQPSLNPKLILGQEVIVSKMPSTVSVIDGDGDLCTVPFRPGVLARHYVLVCSKTAKLNTDWGWLIQPDGKISKVGLEKWNYAAQVAPAPGSWIWAPSRRLGYTDALSLKMARFIATLGPSGGSADALYFGSVAKPMDNPFMVTRSIASSAHARNIPLTPNDWGVIGLLQTPSARMAPTGTASFTYSYVDPYQRYSFGFQPLSWLEFGFRYTRIDNQKFGGPASDPINFAYQDKSLPIKIKLLDESYYLPQMAVGAYDITGTGLFSGQYVVGSKRYDRFDVSLGLGWGYNGARQSLPNPFGSNTSGQGGNLSGNFTGGYFTGKTALFGGIQYQTSWDPLLLKAELDGNNYMHEPKTGAFYSKAPFPVNVGATYLWGNVQASIGYERGNTLMLSFTFTDNLGKLNRSASSAPKPLPVQAKPIGVDWFNAKNKGAANTASTPSKKTIAIPGNSRKDMPADASDTASIDNSATNMKKNELSSAQIDSSTATLLERTQLSPAISYSDILAAVAKESGWEATGLRQVGSEWWVDFDSIPSVYIQDTLQSIIALLHGVAPNGITTFRLRISNYSLQVVEYAVDRKQWMLGKTQLLPPRLAKNLPIIMEPFSIASKAMDASGETKQKPVAGKNGGGLNSKAIASDLALPGAQYPNSGADETLAYASPKRYDWGFGLGYQQIIAGPNNFGPIFAINLMGNGTAKLWSGAWASGTVSLQGPNNLGHYNYTYSGAPNPGNVQRVRTYLSEYWNSSLVTMPNLQLTQVKQAGNNHFFSMYGGYLEWMFGGVGGEYLYRPVSSPIALGININRVKQRDFDQNFNFLSPSYLVNTGHVTVYWDTGWENILVKGSVGQYLAGDQGGTLDISKVFNNGVQIGVYGTKTNMTSANYGEGGFDKGVYVSIPFDAFLGKRTNSVATFMYRPYYKDGGAFLQRQYPLYDLTRMRDKRASSVGFDNQAESLMPIQPF